MGTSSTFRDLFISTAIGASATIAPLPYQIDPLNNINTVAQYKEIKELSNFTDTSYQYQTQFNILIEVSKRLILNAKNIDSEFVDIVNKNFWELI